MSDISDLYPSFYSKKVMDHIKNPRNMGEMKNPDGVGTEGNPICGDVMRLFIKVKNNKIRSPFFPQFKSIVPFIGDSYLVIQEGKIQLQALCNVTVIFYYQ